MGGPNVITKVLQSGRGRQKRVGDRGVTRERHQKGAMLLASELEGENHRPRQAGFSRSWKRQDTNSPLEPLERKATLLTPSFEPARPVCLT